MPFEKPFLNKFGAYFSADVVDLTDSESLSAAAKSCAAGIITDGEIDVKAAIAELERFGRDWDMETMLQICDETYVDWYETDQFQAALRQIIAQLAEALRGYQSMRFSKLPAG